MVELRETHKETHPALPVSSIGIQWTSQNPPVPASSGAETTALAGVFRVNLPFGLLIAAFPPVRICWTFIPVGMGLFQ